MIKRIGSRAAKESLADILPDPVPSKLVIHSENKTDMSVGHLPSPVSPDVIDRSPAVLLHPASPAEPSYAVNSFSLPHSEPLSDEHGGTRSSHDDPIFEEAAPLSISQPLSPSDTTDGTSMMLRQAMGNGTSHTGENHLQPGEQHLVIDTGPAVLALQDATVNVASRSDGHGVQPGEHRLAIDVESSTILGRVGEEVPVTGSDHLQDVVRPGDAVIRIEPPL